MSGARKTCAALVEACDHSDPVLAVAQLAALAELLEAITARLRAAGDPLAELERLRAQLDGAAAA